ncbi:MAG: hypothetical protein VYE77_04150 [Planctomycetota bacterium]|nr:hypothetical protein [Planctomycetota bacterium]
MQRELADSDREFDALVARVLEDPDTADIRPARRAMLGYARKLTKTPDAMVEGDVEALRQAGFGDPEILAIAEVVAYYAYANRIADGLGVQVEDWNQDDKG